MFTYSAKLIPLSKLKTTINFNVSLTESQATFNYTLTNYVPQKLINDPSLSRPPVQHHKPQLERKDQLWLKDCFEFFIKTGKSSYLEFNFSLDGKWNVFQFTNYRENKQDHEDLKLTSFQKQIDNSGLCYSYILKGNIATTCNSSHATAILYEGGLANYFNELGHISPEPDFHLFRKNM